MKKYLPMLIIGILALTCVNGYAEDEVVENPTIEYTVIDENTVRITEVLTTVTDMTYDEMVEENERKTHIVNTTNARDAQLNSEAQAVIDKNDERILLITTERAKILEEIEPKWEYIKYL